MHHNILLISKTRGNKIYLLINRLKTIDTNVCVEIFLFPDPKFGCSLFYGYNLLGSLKCREIDVCNTREYNLINVGSNFHLLTHQFTFNLLWTYTPKYNLISLPCFFHKLNEKINAQAFFFSFLQNTVLTYHSNRDGSVVWFRKKHQRCFLVWNSNKFTSKIN